MKRKLNPQDLNLPAGPGQFDRPLDARELVLLVEQHRPLVDRVRSLCDRVNNLTSRGHAITTPDYLPQTGNMPYSTLSNWLANIWGGVVGVHNLLHLDLQKAIENNQPLISLDSSDWRVAHLISCVPLIEAHIDQVEGLVSTEEHRAQMKGVFQQTPGIGVVPLMQSLGANSNHPNPAPAPA